MTMEEYLCSSDSKVFKYSIPAKMEKAPTSQIQEGSCLQMVKLVKNKLQESQKKKKVNALYMRE